MSPRVFVCRVRDCNYIVASKCASNSASPCACGRGAQFSEERQQRGTSGVGHRHCAAGQPRAQLLRDCARQRCCTRGARAARRKPGQLGHGALAGVRGRLRRGSGHCRLGGQARGPPPPATACHRLLCRSGGAPPVRRRLFRRLACPRSRAASGAAACVAHRRGRAGATVGSSLGASSGCAVGVGVGVGVGAGTERGTGDSSASMPPCGATLANMYACARAWWRWHAARVGLRRWAWDVAHTL